VHCIICIVTIMLFYNFLKRSFLSVIFLISFEITKGNNVRQKTLSDSSPNKNKNTGTDIVLQFKANVIKKSINILSRG